MTAAAIRIKALWRNRPACLNAGNALTAGLLLCLGYAFCRGFYMPNIWSTNYWLINFFDGFGRRALLGTLLYPFGSWRNHYHFIATIQIAVSAALLVLIMVRLTAWQRKNTGIPYIYICICGFFLSWPGAFFFMATGYVENIHYLTIFLALLAPHGAVRVLLASSTVWMHESAAFTCLPLYFAIEWLHFGRRREALATLALSLASFIVIHTLFQTVTPDTIEHYKKSFLAHANYNPRFDYLDVFRETFSGKHFRPRTYFKGVEGNYAVFCLLLACILAQGCATLKKGWSSAASAILVWLAAASPLAMSFFAWDCNRWIFLSLVNSTALFAVFQRHMRSAERISFIAASFLIFLSSDVAWFRGARPYRSVDKLIPFLQDFRSLVSSNNPPH